MGCMTSVIEPSRQSSVNQTISERVLVLLFRQHLSQSSLARQLGMAPNNLNRRIRGTTEWTPSDLVHLAKVLDTSTSFLVGETDEPQRDAVCPPRVSISLPAD